MAMTRQMLVLGNGTDTGKQGDTGPAVWGELMGLYLLPQAGGDTGGTVTVTIPLRDSDTGDARTVLSGVVLTTGVREWAPVKPVSFSSGVGNSGDTGWLPVVLAGETLRAIGKSGTTKFFGHLFAWIKQ